MPRVQAWFPFVARAWLSDEQLTRCSPATRGVYIDALAQMHLQGGTGRLRDSVDVLARMCRCSPAEMAATLAELRNTATADVTENDDRTWTLVNRRMRRDYQRRMGDAARKRASRTKKPAQNDSAESQMSERERSEMSAACPQDADEEQMPEAEGVTGDGAEVSDACPDDESGKRPAAVRPDIDPKAQTDFVDTLQALADYLQQKTGTLVALFDLEELADAHGLQALVTAVEVRAGQGRGAFTGMNAGPVAALRDSIKKRTRPAEPGSFGAWRNRKAREAADRVNQANALAQLERALTFAALPKTRRKEVIEAFCAASGAVNNREQLAEWTCGALAHMLKMFPGEQLCAEAASLADLACATAGAA